MMDDLFSHSNAEHSSASAQAQVAKLRAQITYHDRLYYDEATPEITDAEYDKLFRDLEVLERQHPELHDPNSPTQRVGGKVLDSFASIEHAVPMLSIDDYFSEEEIRAFYQKTAKSAGGGPLEVTVEPKIDGVAASVFYKDGELVYCATRGDGKRGDDVTANARTIKSLPLKLENAPPILEVRGEIYMTYENFEAINQRREAAGQDPLANPRNGTAGTLKQLDPKEVAKRPLSFLAHGIGAYEGDPIESEDAFRQLLKRLRIPHNTPLWHATDENTMVKAINDLEQARHDFGHATDGAVIKVNRFTTREQLGSTSRAPRWAAAFKYPPEQVETKLLDITIQVGRTGTLTPVAELEPVHVSGTTVARATLHNEDEITRKDIRIGDAVIIEKAGEIIPSIVKVLTEKRGLVSQPFSLFDHVDGKCPSCAGPITREEGFSAWKCTNFACPAQAVTRITHFASRKALDLNGLGESVAIRLVDSGMAHSTLDIFDLQHHELADLELEPAKMQDGSLSKPRKFGTKRAQSLLESLDRAKKEMPLSKWIFAMGIDHVGESASREVSRLVDCMQGIPHHPVFTNIIALADLREQQQKISPRNKTHPPKDDAEKFQRQAQYDALKKEIQEMESQLAPYQIAAELGPVATRSLMEFFDSVIGKQILERYDELQIHPKSDNYAPLPQQDDSLILAGKTFVITGTLSQPRPEFKKIIESLGGKVSGSVSKNTSYLLSGEGGGSKYTKAESLQVPILDEEAFQKLIE